MFSKKHEDKSAEKGGPPTVIDPGPQMEKAALEALGVLAKHRGAHAVEFDTTNPREWTVKLLRLELPKYDVMDPALPEKSLGLAEP